MLENKIVAYTECFRMHVKSFHVFCLLISDKIDFIIVITTLCVWSWHVNVTSVLSHIIAAPILNTVSSI